MEVNKGRIVVCVKEVVERISWNESNLRINREEEKRSLNIYDLYAIELALRIKDNTGVEVIAISLGPPYVKDSLKRLISMGVDTCILLSDTSFAGADTLITSYILAKAIGKIDNFSAIFCGELSKDSGTGIVPAELAQLLAIPLIPFVEDITSWEDKNIQVISELKGNTLKIRYSINFPVVIMVSGLKEGKVRPHSLAKLLKVKDEDIIVWDKKDLEIRGELSSPTVVTKLSLYKISKRCKIIEGSSLEEKAISLIKNLGWSFSCYLAH